MDEIIKAVKRRKVYKMRNRELKILCYADDSILIAECEDDLQRLVHKFNIVAKKLNFIAKNKNTGITLSSYGDAESEVGKQIQKANRAAGCLNNTIWRNKHIRTETETIIYKVVIRPIMTCTAETRTDTSKTQRMLEAAEMRILRRITGNTLRDRKNNHITRMTDDRVVKIARDKSPAGRRSFGRPRRRWSDNIT
ncbi:uncharacterized protein LOC130444692 [Diorhabda sublineata]|uniref:uncharacterized protein LOC130444692 n=1 Tax=Diorhabda sublineata TaxID=1163346 RepID=UPI0024E05D53|nr:uncharacterized protein LOC130444692 [Diorhabda sublineata]